MSPPVYTLLIVESPVIARIIQQQAPSSVYVMATGGYSWKPVYDEKNNRLKAVADPENREFRRELKEQAKWAGNIVIATDSDPSGDFIAWSVSRFLKSDALKRAQLHHFGKSGISRLLKHAVPLREQPLETRLKNRSIIRLAWKRNRSLPSIEIAGLTSLFSHQVPYSYFTDRNSRLYRVNRPLRCSPDNWLHTTPGNKFTQYHSYAPLSTFDLLELAVTNGINDCYTAAQQNLQTLFTTTLQYSGESLISYPRTGANSFYSDTWTALQHQYLSFGSRNELKPSFVQTIAGNKTAHESIYPLDLTLTPSLVKGELSHQTGDLYELIYRETLKAISLPVPIVKSFTSVLHSGHQFYTLSPGSAISSPEILPVRTIADIGARLYSIGVISPSSFGKKADRWISEKILESKDRSVWPGGKLKPFLNKADKYAELLQELVKLSNRDDLSPETIRSIIS